MRTKTNNNNNNNNNNTRSSRRYYNQSLSSTTFVFSIITLLLIFSKQHDYVTSFQPTLSRRCSMSIRNSNCNCSNNNRRSSTSSMLPSTAILLNSKNDNEDNTISNNNKKNNNLLQDQSTENPLAPLVASLSPSRKSTTTTKDNKDEQESINTNDIIKTLFKRLANLSLQDYYWRSDVFKKNEADRKVEESLARMMGEDVTYVRPMDAGEEKIGPLGRAEKQLVEWLSLVIEEEGRRARLIASMDGELVRPIDLQQTNNGGPLSALENAAVDFFSRISESEKERVKTSTLRPKDVIEEKRGPLGNFEASVVNALEEIRLSEQLRMEQSRKRGGEVVRPIDVPGPLGEAERWYLELITAEKQRGKDRQKNDGKLVRPKDASLEGPLGLAERKFSQAMNVLRDEETERLRSIRRVLNENRPMEKNRNSFAGWTEAVLVGIFRAPQLMFRVIDRVKELLESENLDEKDQDILKNKK